MHGVNNLLFEHKSFLSYLVEGQHLSNHLSPIIHSDPHPVVDLILHQHAIFHNGSQRARGVCAEGITYETGL
jgi:hypothetical protein